MQRPLLEVKDLAVDFIVSGQKIEAVKKISFSVFAQETVVIAGESGSGKTVSCLALTKLLPANAHIRCGEVLFRGRNLVSFSEQALQAIRGSKIAYCFQEPTSYLNPVYTIEEQIKEVLWFCQHIKGKQARNYAIHLLEQVKIKEPLRVLTSYPHQLSGGMNQRVFLAMGLAGRPELFIADEPTTALDVTIEQEILKLLMDLKKEYNFALLFITHNLAIARKIAQRVYIMHQGLIVEEKKTEELFSNPEHQHAKELIAAYEKIGKI
ncbi:MAG: ABC transporter ATP-binding protein [Candidatus Omnitrophica bacterium]|nr:ABC transporter ATP-binding protein [Candidatus Omnitrophota bacterium]